MPDDAVAAHENGIANALAVGYALLEQGASAVDAVEVAVAMMEDDETFDAGKGSFLTQDGRVQMDALLMNGDNLRTGGVACVERLHNPIRAGFTACARQVAARVFCRNRRGADLRGNTAWLCATTWRLVIPREQERLLQSAGGRTSWPARRDILWKPRFARHSWSSGARWIRQPRGRNEHRRYLEQGPRGRVGDLRRSSGVAAMRTI